MPKKSPSKKATRTGSPARSVKESSFHKVIYLRRNELKNIQILKEAECWPETVFIMDDNFDIDGPIWAHPVGGEPCTLFAWAESEFKKCYHAPLEHVHQALRIWWGLHEQIITYLIHCKNFSANMERLVYNTVWCLLGYEDGQPSEVLDLAHKIMLDPDFEKCGMIIKFPTASVTTVKNKDPDKGYPAPSGDHKDKSIYHGQETIPFRTARKSEPTRPRTPIKVIQRKSAAGKDTSSDDEDSWPGEKDQDHYIVPGKVLLNPKALGKLADKAKVKGKKPSKGRPTKRKATSHSKAAHRPRTSR